MNHKEKHIAIQATIFSLLTNTALALVKVVTGILGHSDALVADAIESCTDIFSSLLVLIGLKFAHKPADEDHPFGHGRAETLVTFVVVMLLIISATVIAYTSILNIMRPQRMPESYTLWVLGAIIIWKELSYRYVIRQSTKSGSPAVHADAWHHRSYAITSASAFLGISLALLLGPGFEALDDWAALIAALVIYFNAYLIFRPLLGELMEEQIYDDQVQKIRKLSMDIPGVKGTEKCFVRKAGMAYNVELHVLVDANLTVAQGHDIAHDLKDYLMGRLTDLGHILIHIEPC